MSLPLPVLHFYRLPDVSVTVATIVGLLDALWTAVGQTVDFHGTSLPSTHLWPWARYQNATTTEAVYTTGVPGSSAMTQTPRIIFAGRVTIGTPSMLYDTATASNLMVGMNLRGGAFNAWDNAAPFTSGVFSGFVRIAATGANAVGTIVRVFVSAEVVFVQIIQANTSHYYAFAGACVEPFTNDTVNDADSDNRLYGIGCTGGGGVAALSLSANSTQDFFTSGNANGSAHSAVFVPGTVTSGTVGMYAIAALQFNRTAANVAMAETLSGAVLNLPAFFCRLSSGAAMGRLREIYYLGSFQGGTTYTVAGADKVHVVGPNNLAAVATMSIRAA